MRLIMIVVFGIILAVGLEQVNAQTAYYADCHNGSDNWDGTCPTYSWPNHGPKQTIQATIWLANAMDTVKIAGGGPTYDEAITIEKNLTLTSLTGDVSIKSLLIANSDVSLNSSIQIEGTLTLTNGTITVDWNDMIGIANESPEALTINEGMIIGRVGRTIAANATQPYVFTDAHTAIVPDGTQPASYVYLQLITEQPPHIPTGQTAISRYYVISGDSLNGTLRLAYRESELNTIVEQNLIPFGWYENDIHWSERNGTLNSADNYVEVPNVTLTGWSRWTLGDASSPLPIQLASFSAVVNNGHDVQLNWTTLTETNNYGFYVQQRPASSSDYVDLPNSFVPGHGTTIEPHNYSWIHAGVLPGTYYYRLKQIDLDGATHYTDAREVTISSPTGVTETTAPAEFQLAQNYPNPFNPSTQIQFAVRSHGFTTLTVFDVLGRELTTLYSGIAGPGRLYTVSFDASKLTNGVYYYKLVNNNESTMRKMLLLK